MKKFDKLKRVQIAVMAALAIVSLIVIFSNRELFHIIGTNAGVRGMMFMLWLVLAVSFLFILLDYSLFARFKSEYRELDYAVHSDPVAGIANRYSIDAIIDKYRNREVPKNLGCVMFELANLKEVNDKYGRDAGDNMIQAFSSILKLTSVQLCIVSRNGGNKFLALFEDCTGEKLELFLHRIEAKVRSYNDNGEGYSINYRYGQAFNEGASVATINDLIALADSRIK